MRLGKLILRLTFLAGVISLLAVLILLLYPHDRSLLVSGKRVVTAGRGKSIGWYAWLPNREALVAWKSDDIMSQGPAFRYARYEPLTGLETPMDSLDNWTPDPEDYLELSPDGQGLLHHLIASDGYLGGVAFTSTDQSRRFNQKCSIEEPWVQTRWLSDSHHWVELISKQAPRTDGPLDKILIHTIEHPISAQTIAIPHRNPLHFTVRISDTDFISVEDRLIVNDCDLSHGTSPNPIHNVKIIATGPRLDISQTQVYDIVLPLNRQVFGLAFAPHGDKIAWLLETEHSSPLAAFLNRFWHASHIKKEIHVDCCVSNLDGTGMRLIGYVKTGEEDISSQEYEHDPPQMLRWLPDDKTLSFSYQGSLWMVSVR